MLQSFKELTRFERYLWLISVFMVTLSYLLLPEKDWIHLMTSLVGVTSLIFISKGYILGQVLGVIFSLLYGLISFYFHYYGEMITYLGMTAPMAVFSIISWINHPYEDTNEVRVKRTSIKEMILLCFFTSIVTVLFYFILKYFNTAHLYVSTLSIATSFYASLLTFLRSPFYALAYSCNDIVLVLLWILASFEDASYFPMVICFLMFLINDIYGYYNWMKMLKRQEKN